MVARTSRLRSSWRAIPECMGKRTALFAVMIGLALAVSVCADDNVRAVQEKLRDDGFYLGEIDGAYSSQLAAALTRYQVRKGLAVTGQLDVDTSNALGAKPASAPAVRPAPVSDTGSSGDGDISTERLRDYLGAFVLAGLDPQVGSEADFFADRVKYYDQGVIDREQIRNDLQAYAARWPERHFWFAGNIIIEPPHRKRVRVTFPLRYELRNGATYSSGTINKTLVLEPVGDDLQIVAVSEGNAE